MTKKKITFALLLALFALGGCTPTNTYPHLSLGNPSQATADPANITNYLMKKPQYALAYDSTKGIPNWVSWQLNNSWLGGTDRADDFRPDPELPQGWYQVKPKDYTNTGYDRGHMAPSADRTRTPEDNSATFLMTNIVPQTSDNNRGPWKQLEDYCRDLVKEGKELYVIAGPVGKQKTIGSGKVTVPAQTWKIIVVLDKPGDRVTAKTRTISVKIPNTPTLKSKDWRSYRVAIDAIEKATGYDFLSNVSPSIQATIESSVDKQ
ncbi:MAG TPA: DNA/RNA non-specific endonuclease [Oscillatoriaceae cyanobacterium M33_DOE_052]|uniref:Endonuclease n=1 Tax=Planktothricoides sp. SpSt-374 TaxID=2282167 RepID=A0A7C3ZES0_9CYAN|nr:DNA/RNA non-specific endonuclease [Oscillatoriaceae cyanobacterium M33_DOE_052]